MKFIYQVIQFRIVFLLMYICINSCAYLIFISISFTKDISFFHQNSGQFYFCHVIDVLRYSFRQSNFIQGMVDNLDYIKFYKPNISDESVWKSQTSYEEKNYPLTRVSILIHSPASEFHQRTKSKKKNRFHHLARARGRYVAFS